MKRIFIIIILTLAIFKVNAQDYMEALKYSQNFYGGTARFTAMGGAFGALGADFSTLSVNPAGIGLYKTSEFTFTPSFYIGNTSAVNNGSPSYSDNNYDINLGNIGLVYDFFKRGKYSEGDGWKDIQFGFGINRLNDFNNSSIVEGNSASSPMMAQYLNNANNHLPTDLDPFSTQLAYQTYLLNPLSSDSTKYSSPFNGAVTQQKTVTTSGSINEFVLTLGGNYSDKLYFGATLGIPFIRYNEQSTYKETVNGTTDTAQSFTVNDNLSTTGAGVNVKLGLIYRPIEFLRLGIAVHSPTFYSLEDQWTRNIETHADSGIYSATSPQGLFDYQLTTPWHIIGSLALIIGNYGLISADYEFVDYSVARLRSDNADFIDANQNIQQQLKATSNIRIGTEWRLNPIILRAGYDFYQSPVAGDNNSSVFSVGFGFKEKKYFLDFAYAYSYTKQSVDNYLYDPAYLNSTNTLTGSSIKMTIGFKY